MKRRTIIVGGMIAGVPYQGGWTWAMLQFLLGFKELGYEVYFVESLKRAAIVPVGASLQGSANAAYFRRVTSEFGIEQNSALLLEDTEQAVGLTPDRILLAARQADLFVSVSGNSAGARWASEIPVRVYLDLDPGFTQSWHEMGQIDLHLGGHTHFATVGLAIGKTPCVVPGCGIEWIPTVQPIVLSRWPEANGITYNALTTLANWRGYGSIQRNGVFWGQKAHSLRQFIGLPRSTSEQFLLALAIHAEERADLEALTENGWQLIDPATVASTPAQYQKFVQGSKAEFGIAKSGYVHSRCGWFSDRSVCYLASGRPVIAQDTGFSRFLPTGRGLFAFDRSNDILGAIDALRSDYTSHARAARAIAEEFFDSRKVLTSLLDRVGVAS